MGYVKRGNSLLLKRDLEEGQKLALKSKIDLDSHLMGLEIQMRDARRLRAQRAGEIL
jgi:hypothetical protein